MNYVIGLRAEQGHLFVRYANKQTGPSASVWMVPAYRADQSGTRLVELVELPS